MAIKNKNRCTISKGECEKLSWRMVFDELLCNNVGQILGFQIVFNKPGNERARSQIKCRSNFVFIKQQKYLAIKLITYVNGGSEWY